MTYAVGTAIKNTMCGTTDIHFGSIFTHIHIHSDVVNLEDILDFNLEDVQEALTGLTWSSKFSS